MASGKSLFMKFVKPFLKQVRKSGAAPHSVYAGKVYKMPGMRLRTIKYTKRSRSELKALRRQFDSVHRGQFLNKVAKLDNSQLAKMGLSPKEIEAVRAGRVPEGFSVHHIVPLDDSGTNSMDNLILIRNYPDHQLVTNWQRYMTGGLKPNDSINVEWPFYPPGSLVWPPPDMGAVPI